MFIVKKLVNAFGLISVTVAVNGGLLLGSNSATSAVIASTVVTKKGQQPTVVKSKPITNEVAICLFGICVNTPPVTNIFGDIIKKEVANNLAKAIGEQAPITSSASSVFPTVNSLPGSSFNPIGNIQQIAQHINTSVDGSVMLQPGDYNIPIDVFCMKQFASSPNGHRYLLARLKGKKADVITALNSRTTGSGIPHSQLQVLSWNIQAGMKYEEMTTENQAIIDKLLPEHKQKLSRSYWEEILTTWNKFSSTIPGIPSFEESLDKLGDVGRFVKTLRQVRSELIAHGNDYNSLASLLIPAGNSNARGGYTNTPWSKINEHVYGRLVTEGNAHTPAEIQMRVLPVSSNKSAVKVDVTNLVADPQNSGIQPLSISPKVPKLICDESESQVDEQKLTDKQKKAIKIVTQFRCNSNPSPWKLNRQEVANRLEELIKNPDLVQQKGLNACGPAAFFYVWFKRAPDAAVQFATTLYNDGMSKIGNISIKPRKHLLEYEGERKTVAADWMFLSALRDSENNHLKFEEESNNRIAAITTPSEIKRWLEATGLYNNVVDNTGFHSNFKDSWKTQNFEHARNLLTYVSNRDVIMLIDSRMLQDGLIPYPNHYIVLTSKVEDVKGKVSFNYWTWGEYNKPQPFKIDKLKFLKNYYGAVIAHPIE
jgi:hypothetical protein